MRTSFLAIFTALLMSVAGLAQAQSVGQHLILFKGNGVPSGFSDDVSALGGSVVYTHDIGFAVVSGLDDSGAVALGQSSKIQDIQLDEVFELETVLDPSSIDVAGTINSPEDPAAAFFYPWQWNMRAIDADVAWANGRLGSEGVTVAILDTGIDYTHPELNGRVDLSRSVSFVADDDFYVDLIFPGRHPITDLHYHGTHVASTVVSNGGAIAGVTSQTTLMGVKVCSVFGGCPFSSVISGVLHAADNGADVANMSLGGSFIKAGNGRFVGFINKVFNYANSRGMVVVVSAGNSAIDLDHDGNSYKAYCSAPNTICVSATGPVWEESRSGPWEGIDSLAGYSNFGRSAINVAAPGGNYSAVWASCSQTNLFSSLQVCATGNYVLGLGGTSMAAPHVSGLAALVVEDVGPNHPGRVKTAIQQGADDLGQRGTDPHYGKGRINVGNTAD